MDHTGQYYEAHDFRKYLIPNTCERANNWTIHDNNMKNMTFEKLIPNTCRRAYYETMQDNIMSHMTSENTKYLILKKGQVTGPYMTMI